ncbi:unnamed protein product [Meloidogyne enterolobii]|uniref:Uncharacterized protein n=1 Tax=Meloidogyne enterolobii TaxID=390850 RepID=A0ACB0ZFJ4_MELEN
MVFYYYTDIHFRISNFLFSLINFFYFIAKEFKPYNDHLSHYQFDDPYFQQFLPQNITPTGSCDFDKYFPTFSHNIDPEGIDFPAYDGRVFNTGFWGVTNESENNMNQPEKRFITDFDPEGIIYNISNHFNEFGWPEDEKFLSDYKVS